MGWKKKEKPILSEEEIVYRKKTRRKKILMYAVLIAATVIVALCSYRMFLMKITTRVNPQISRAMVQISRRLPELEKNEQALRDVYEQMLESRKELLNGQFRLNQLSDIRIEDVQDDEDLEELVTDTLSWTNSLTQIMVGSRGYVMAVNQDDVIIAHPDPNMVGERVFYTTNSLSDVALTMGDIPPGSLAEDLSFKSVVVAPEDLLRDFDISRNLEETVYGGVLFYNDIYLVCGVPLAELQFYARGQTILITLVFFLVVWLFVRYISLVLDRHTERRRSFRTKLLPYFMLNGLIIFVMTFYLQVLTDITTVLRTMERYAKTASVNLAEYTAEAVEINDWLDWQYLIQC